MAGPGPDCRVYVDGALIADDYIREGPAAGDPALLSGLTVRWGRDTTVDQPDPGTSTMTLLDPPGGASFTQQLRVGAKLRVTATGPAWTDAAPGEPDESYGPSTITYGDFDDPGFPYVNYAAPTDPADYTAERITADPFRGAGAWSIRGILPRRVWNYLRPGPRPGPGDPPGAWDAIPRFGDAANAWRMKVTYRSWHASSTQGVNGPALWPVFVANPAALGGANRGATGRIPLPDSGGQWVTRESRVTLLGNTSYPNSWLSAGIVFDPIQWQSPGTLGPSWADADASWEQVGRIDIDDLTISPDLINVSDTATVIVFDGRITDVSVSLEGDDPTIELTAADLGAELANRVIGDEPWAASTALVRAQKIITAAGSDVTLYVDVGARPFPVSYVDVDARSVLELLQELAASVDGVIWVGTHPTTGPYLRLEYAPARAPLFRLSRDPGSELLVVTPVDGSRVLQVSACDLLAAPARFVQDVSDVVTVVAVRWLEQTLDDDGFPAPTERSVIVTDPALVAELGTRRLSLGTILASSAAASTVAEGILARTATTDYRASGLLLAAADLDYDDQQLVTRLLDGTARTALPMLLVDLPEWAPADDSVPLYLEGGTYSYVAGSWALDLIVSSAAATGAPLTWLGAGTARWADFDPSVAWRSLIGIQPFTGI